MQLSHGGQGAHVFRKTTSAITHPGEKKRKSDAAIMSNAATYVVDVAAHAFAKIGHLVDEADFRCQQSVGDILGHLGAFRRHDEKRVFGTQERLVKLLQNIGCKRVANPNDHPVGLFKVVDRGAFFQKFGIASHMAFAAC